MNESKNSKIAGNGDSMAMDDCTNTNEDSLSVVAPKGKAIVLLLYLFLYSHALNNFLQK